MGAESSIVAQPCVRVVLLRVYLVFRLVRGDSIGPPWVDPLHGTPCFPFYRPRKSTGYDGGKEKNEREKKSFRITGSFFSFMRVSLTL